MDTAVQQSNTVVAFFDNRTDAQNALDNLERAGVGPDEVTIVEGGETASTTPASGDSSHGFLDSLKDMFMPPEDQQHYAEGLRRGGYVVSVRARPDNYETVLDILETNGSVDMDERSGAWRSEGWSGDKDGTIEVSQEQMRIGKRDVSHGRVRVRAYTVSEDVTENVDLRDETVHVNRRPVDRVVSEADAAFQDRTIEVEEVDEEAVVSKETRVVEEIDVGKDVETHAETVGGTVRHTEVEIDDERR